MEYTVKVIIGNKAEKQLEKLHKGDNDLFKKIIKTIYGYAENPKGNFDVKVIEGEKNKFRIRVNNYRILFKYANEEMIIVEVNTRGDIYKKG